MASFDIGIPNTGQFDFGRVFDIAKKESTNLVDVKMATYETVGEFEAYRRKFEKVRKSKARF